MAIPTDKDIDRNIWLVSKEELESYFNTILGEDPEAPDTLAEFLLRVQSAFSEGPQGAMRAQHSMSDAIELLYLETAAHHTAFELYRLWLEGRLKPDDEPLTLIKAAIDRSAPEAVAREAEFERRSKTQRKRKEAEKNRGPASGAMIQDDKQAAQGSENGASSSPKGRRKAVRSSMAA